MTCPVELASEMFALRADRVGDHGEHGKLLATANFFCLKVGFLLSYSWGVLDEALPSGRGFLLSIYRLKWKPSVNDPPYHARLVGHFEVANSAVRCRVRYQ